LLRDADERALSKRLLIALVLLTVVLYGRDLTRSTGFSGDSFHHLMNGIFIFDALHEPRRALADPLAYATNYYRHFPAVNLGYYMPVFPAIQAALMMVFGVSPVTGQLAVLLMAVVLTLFSFAWFRLRFDPWWAAGATVLLMSTPQLVFWGRDIMLELPVLAFMVGSMWLFERLIRSERPTWSVALGWALLTTLALWTKQQSLLLLGAFGLSILATSRRRRLMYPPFVVAGVIVALSASLLVALHLHLGGQAVGETIGHEWEGVASRFAPRRWSYYIRALGLPAITEGPTPSTILPVPTLIAAMLGLVWVFLRRETYVLSLLTWGAVFYVMHTFNVAVDVRYACLWVPPFAALAAIGLRHLQLRLPLTGRYAGRLAGLSLGAVLMIALVGYSILRGLAVKVPQVPSAYQRVADDLRDRMPPFNALTLLSDRPGRAAVCYRLAVEERRGTADIYSFGRILRAEQVIPRGPGGPPDPTVIAESLRLWNVKYLLIEKPTIEYRRVGVAIDNVLKLGEFKEVSSYPIRLSYKTVFPQRTLSLYERIGPFTFDPAAPPPDIRTSRVPIPASLPEPNH